MRVRASRLSTRDHEGDKLALANSPRILELVIFVLTTTTTGPITLHLCACARGKYANGIFHQNITHHKIYTYGKV